MKSRKQKNALMRRVRSAHIALKHRKGGVAGVNDSVATLQETFVPYAIKTIGMSGCVFIPIEAAPWMLAQSRVVKVNK